MKTQTDLIDWGLYGAMIRHARIKLGYKTAESFSPSLWRRTRVYISRDVLYKIESGKQVPDTLQFMALNIALFGEFFPIPKVISTCMGAEWEELSEAYEREATPSKPWISDKWKDENTEEEIKELSKQDVIADRSLKPEELGYYADDNGSLFADYITFLEF